MSNSNKVTTARKPRKSPSPKPSLQANDQAELLSYMSSLELEVTPSVHVNGRSFPFALVTLDIGQPLKPNKISNEQQGEIVSRLRKLGVTIAGSENVRVAFDNNTGVFWAYVG